MNHVTDLDSNCYCLPKDADGPTNEVCGNPAIGYVELPQGIRRYICAAHEQEVERHGGVNLGANARECERCQRVTPDAEIEYSGGDFLCVDCRGG